MIPDVIEFQMRFVNAFLDLQEQFTHEMLYGTTGTLTVDMPRGIMHVLCRDDVPLPRPPAPPPKRYKKDRWA